jgi:hypothetical protein
MTSASPRQSKAWLRAGPFFFAFAALLVVVAPLMLAFAWQPGLASFGDDSVSYLLLAQHIAGSSNPFIAEWAGHEAHFPPLLPLVLAMTGGAGNFALAHAVVAAFAVASLVLVYAYASRQLPVNGAGLWVALFFVLMPTAWIGIKGILTEPMFLFFSLAALLYHDARVEDEAQPGTAAWLIFGLLLACALLTRVLGVALVAAYAAHLLVRFARGRRNALPRRLVPFAPVVLLTALWLLLRPHTGGDRYQGVAMGIAQVWLSDPLQVFLASARLLFDGWIASFSSEAAISAAPKAVFAAVGLLGVAGMLRRLGRNRLDAWYVAASLVIMLAWAFTFSAENSRRLFYPLVPLFLVYAAETLVALCGRLPERMRGPALAATAAVPALLCLPALWIVHERSRDTQPVIEGMAYTYADITDYYTTIDRDTSRAYAAMNAAILGGLQALQTVTPAGARIMWIRPEYVAFLGRRHGVPLLYRWTPRELAEQVRATNSDYIIASRLFKTDITEDRADLLVVLKGIAAYSAPAYNLEGDTFLLMKVDPAKLDAVLAAGSGPARP